MNGIILKLIFLINVALLINSWQSIAQLKIEAQIRPRFEYRDGYQKTAMNGSVAALFIKQRTRLGIGYESEFLDLKLTPQDVRLWGDEAISNATGVFGDHASVELFEAYAGIKLGQAARITIGRQQLVYDNEWLLSARNWNQQGIAYDAAVLKLNPPNWQIDLGLSWNTMTETRSDNFYPSDRIKSLNYLWVKHNITPNWNVSLTQIMAGYTENDLSNKLNIRYTSGFYSILNIDDLSFNSNLYFQYGKNQQARSISAFLFTAEASYRTGKLTPALGINYLSGNSETGVQATKDRLFSRLYGAQHRHFGFMDYFRNMVTDTREGGLINYYINLNYTVSETINIRNTTHYFQLAQTNPDTPPSRKLGWENDLVLRYKFQDWGTLEFGYCFFLPGESVKIIQDVPNNKFSQFIYLQLTVIQGLLN